MRSLLTLPFLALLFSACSKSGPAAPAPPVTQSFYFPPVGTSEWATIAPESLGWKTANLPALYQFLDSQQTRAFLILKNGKIVAEKYFGQNIGNTAPFSQSSQWYWASAGKTLTAFAVGKAQQEGFLSLNHKTSQYLGAGWTSAPAAKEDLITIRHQLTMTTGLDDGTGDVDNTSPSALVFKADAGNRWAYHNAPYTLLQKVVSNATSQTFNSYFEAKLKSKIGMEGQWIQSGYNSVYWSSARSMARYGLLILNKGKWQSEDLLGDSLYFKAMVNTSQNINLSYGYLWWLNGKSSAMVPQSQAVFNTSLCPSAPADMFAAMGKDGQLLNIIPSEGLVVVRMGNEPVGSLVPMQFQVKMWEKINAVIR